MKSKWSIVQVDTFHGRRDRGRQRVVARAATKEEAWSRATWLASQQPKLKWKSRRYVVVGPPDAAAAQAEIIDDRSADYLARAEERRTGRFRLPPRTGNECG